MSKLLILEQRALRYRMRAASPLPMTASIRGRGGMGRDFNPFTSAHVSGHRPKQLVGPLL